MLVSKVAMEPVLKHSGIECVHTFIVKEIYIAQKTIYINTLLLTINYIFEISCIKDKLLMQIKLIYAYV